MNRGLLNRVETHNKQALLYKEQICIVTKDAVNKARKPLNNSQFMINLFMWIHNSTLKV